MSVSLRTFVLTLVRRLSWLERVASGDERPNSDSGDHAGLPVCQAGSGLPVALDVERRALTSPRFHSAGAGIPAGSGLATVSAAGQRGGCVKSGVLTVFLSSPDADQVDSTTLLGKADLGFYQPVSCPLNPFSSCHSL